MLRFPLVARSLLCTLLLLCSLMRVAIRPVDSQSIAALHPSSLPASALRLTVFGAGFNTSREYTCGVVGPGGAAAACPRTLPRSTTMIECS
jgi:hypothetical protein